MSKSMKIILVVVLLSAFALVTVLGLHYISLGRQLRENESLLASSRQVWETTAAEKEALQDNLKALKNDLKEAELSLKEAEDRSEELKNDIADLQAEISALKQKLNP